jgi:hypothetical protein
MKPALLRSTVVCYGAFLFSPIVLSKSPRHLTESLNLIISEFGVRCQQQGFKDACVVALPEGG